MARSTKTEGGVSFGEVKTFLLTASPKQRSEILMLLGASSEQADAQAPAEATHGRLLYEQASHLMEKATGGAPAPYEIAMKSLSSDIKQACIGFDAFLVTKHTGLDVLTAQTRVFLYHMLMTWVASYLRDVGIPLTVKTLLQQARNIAVVVDHALPGYAAAGLLPRVFATLHRRL